MVWQECEGHEDVFEDCSGEDPYNRWNEDDEGGIGGDGASPLDEYEGGEGVLLVPSVFGLQRV